MFDQFLFPWSWCVNVLSSKDLFIIHQIIAYAIHRITKPDEYFQNKWKHKIFKKKNACWFYSQLTAVCINNATNCMLNARFNTSPLEMYVKCDPCVCANEANHVGVWQVTKNGGTFLNVLLPGNSPIQHNTNVGLYA